jgi:hypothetical protein
MADAVVTGLESATPRTEELDGLIQLLNDFDPGQLDAKRAWTFGPDGLANDQTEAQIFVESAFQAAGIMVLPPATPDVGLAADMVEKLKEAGRRSVRRQMDSGARDA